MAKKGKTKGKKAKNPKKKEDIEKLQKKLEQEAEKKIKKETKTDTEKELRQKCKDLATIIEEMSSAVEEVPSGKIENVLEPKLKELDQKFTTQLQDLKGSLESLEKKIGKSGKKGDLSGISSEIEEKIEPRLAGLEERMKALDKISELEEKVKNLPEEPKEGKQTEGKKTPKKLSILEERVFQTMQEDMIELKEAVENLYNSFDRMRDKTDKNMQKIQEALTPETLEKLEELIAFLDKAVPAKVKDEVGNKFNSVFDQLRELREETSALDKMMKKVLEDVSESRQNIEPIKGIKEDVDKLQLERDKLYKLIEDIKIKSMQNDNDLEMSFKTQIDDIIKKFDGFDEVIENHLKSTGERVNKLLSEFSQTKLQEMEKKYYAEVSAVQESVKNLNSELSKFEELVNSTFDSLRSGMEKFNLKIDKLKEKEKDQHLKINQKILDNKVHLDKTIDALSNDIEEKLNRDMSGFREEFEEKSKDIEMDLNQKFSELTKNKIQEIENRYSDIVASVEERAKEMDLNLSKFKDSLTSNLNTIETSIKKLNTALNKIENKNKDNYQELEKKISNNKDLFEHKLNEYPELVEKKVNKLFIDLTESKISEMEKKHSDVMHWIQDNVNKMSSDLSDFKEFVNSSFENINTENQTMKEQLNKMIEEAETVKLVKEDIQKSAIKKISKDFENKLNSISSEISALKDGLKEVSESLKYFNTLDQKIAKLASQRNEFLENIAQQTAIINSVKEMTKSELDKKLEADRAKYEKLMKNIMEEKRSLEEMMKRQKEKAVAYLKELKAK